MFTPFLFCLSLCLPLFDFLTQFIYVSSRILAFGIYITFPFLYNSPEEDGGASTRTKTGKINKGEAAEYNLERESNANNKTHAATHEHRRKKKEVSFPHACKKGKLFPNLCNLELFSASRLSACALFVLPGFSFPLSGLSLPLPFVLPYFLSLCLLNLVPRSRCACRRRQRQSDAVSATVIPTPRRRLLVAFVVAEASCPRLVLRGDRLRRTDLL